MSDVNIAGWSEILIARLPCGHPRDCLTKGNLQRTDEGDCTVCLLCDEVERLTKERDEKTEYLNRLRAETVGALTKAGICMLVDADPTGPGEVRRAVQRLAAERDEALAEATKALARNAQLCNALECVLDLNRVRGARVEPPPLGERVLVWQGVYWAPGCSLEAGKWNIEWRSGFPFDGFPFWLPMPPPPLEPR